MKIKLFILILYVIQTSVFGQVQSSVSQNKIDSLQRLLTGSGTTEQVDILNTLASWFAPVNFDSSIMYSAQAVRIGSVYGYPRGIGVARFNTGNAYFYKMDFKNALLSYLSALKILEENDAWKELSEVTKMIGHINFFIRRHEKAIYYYQQAIKYILSSGNKQSLPEIFHALNLTYWRADAIDSAILYSNKLLEYSKINNDLSSQALALTLFGQTYIDERAVDYCNEALEIAKKLNDENLIAILYNNLASYYDRSSPLFEIHGDLKLSRRYYEKALQIVLNTDYSILQAMIPAYLAEIDIEEGKYQQAETNINRSEEKLNDFYKFPEKTSSPPGFFSFGKIFDYYIVLRTKNELYNTRYKLAIARGEYDKAINYLNLYYQSKDTLNSAQQGRQLELLMAEAETEKIDQKIRSLAQDNELNQLRLSQTRFIYAGTAAGVLIISLFLLLFFQRKRWKAEQKSINLEQKLLRSQMNPHFIFNSLASIQNFVINQKATEASIYLARFSQLVRNILDSSVDENVPLQKEIETIQNYLELQKVRYAGQFDYSLSVDEAISVESMLIPPMLAQPFIENSIEHGIKYKETPGHIDIRFQLESDMIRFEVEDDGVGREKAQEIESKHKRLHRSMSTSITQERLIELNKKLKHKIRMEIFDLKDNLGNACGTRVTFGIPVVVK